LLSEKESKS